jgi:serine phosphatase RsbU (regulator of sigma subunit)
MAQSELTVGQVMQPHPILVRPGETVRNVLELMTQAHVGSVLVASEEGRLLGIFTERDLLRRIGNKTIGWRDEPVSEWMTANPRIVEPHVGWDRAVSMLQEYRIRHLPVIEGERIVGILSSRHLMARRTEVLNQRVEQRTRELQLVNEQLMARDAEARHNLRAAGRLQNKLLLPQSPPDWNELQWAMKFQPLDHLGGDYYDYAQPDEDHLGILMADASGHSVAATMVAIMARFAFTETARRTTSPGEVLSAMNERLMDLVEERFVSAFYGVLNRRTRTLRYSSAGHPYPLHFHAASGSVKPLVAQGFLLGIIPGEVYTERSVMLGQGDAVCFYTDGVIEARNEIGEQYGEERLTRLLERTAHGTASEIRDAIQEDFRAFVGGVPLSDDLTLVVVKLAGAPNVSTADSP